MLFSAGFRSLRNMAQDNLVKPFLKWVGGKRQLVPEIKAKYLPPDYQTYYEPFVGAGALFLDLRPSLAVINDSNTELINCYLTIKNSVEELIASLRSHHNEKEYYYQVRAWDRDPDYREKSSIERAARIIFLNKTCYNGLFRVNASSQFNAPFGRYKSPKILDEDVLRAVSSYLNESQAKILNLDFQAVLQPATTGDFIYFDPPYDPVSSTSSFTSYGANGFNQAEQIRLQQTFISLANRGCQVLLSNSKTEFIVDLYKDYRIETIGAARTINSNALKRGKIDEVLVMNY
jgi:DNA adenine methylase